jgi:hypothetical protein
MKFRKKPIVIDAIPVSEAVASSMANWAALPSWLSEAYEQGNIVFTPTNIHITTLEGVMVGQLGDWVLRGVKGELYPCRGDIFEATYEKVEDDNVP